jgi:hypothetical protein
MSLEVPHAHMRESTGSISALSLSLLRQLLDQILPFASSPIDVLFLSFQIYGIYSQQSFRMIVTRRATYFVSGEIDLITCYS